MNGALRWALQVRMRNGIYRGRSLGRVLLQYEDIPYLVYLARHRRGERCGLAARVLLLDVCEQQGTDPAELIGEQPDLLDDLRAEVVALAEPWPEAA